MNSNAPWSLRLSGPDSVRAGHRVRFTLTLSNDASGPIDFYLRGREIAFDVVVTSSDGQVVWRRLQGEIIAAIVQVRSLAAGETLALHAQWDQRSNEGTHVAPSDYSVRAFLLTESDPLESPPISLRIEAPL